MKIQVFAFQFIYLFYTLSLSLGKVMKKNKKAENIKEKCLLSISEAKKILLEKYNINMNEKNIDEKVRFLLGKCNPIILVPGIFSTRLSIKIYCKKLYEKDKDFLKKMRVFCMDNLCKNINEEKEEETLFLRFFGPFGILMEDNQKMNITNNNHSFLEFKNKYSACLGFFMTIFND